MRRGKRAEDFGSGKKSKLIPSQRRVDFQTRNMTSVMNLKRVRIDPFKIDPRIASTNPYKLAPNSSFVSRVSVYQQDLSYVSSVAFIGDSNMQWQMLQYANLYGKTCKVVGKRCDFAYFFPEQDAIKRSNFTWVKPRMGVEGPVGNGLEHPGCVDCNGCQGRQCGDSNEIMFYPIEFARDVMLQSPQHKTTQEVFGKHMSRHPSQLCVLNVGLHDLAIRNITDDQYATNVFEFINLLQGCGHVLWQHTSSVRGDRNRSQSDIRIEKWNSLIERYSEVDSALTGILDVYDFSKKFTRVDNVHFVTDYYVQVARALPKLKMK